MDRPPPGAPSLSFEGLPGIDPLVDDLEVPESLAGSDASPPMSGRRAAPTPREQVNAAMDRYAAGDDKAFPELYDLMAPRLYKYLLRQTRDPVRAEDLLQQTMLQLHMARGRFLPGAEVTAWAFAIARRLLINSYRRRKRETARNEAQSSEAPIAPAATDEILHSKRVALTIERELLRLPEGQRIVFELMKKEGLSSREVAEVLGTTSNAIKLRAHRAYVALRTAIDQEVDPDGR